MSGNIGYDVEFFLQGRSGYIPAERIMSGTKGRAGAIAQGVVGHPDNIMAEIASAAPFDHDQFASRIKHDLRKFRQHVAPVAVCVVPGITVTNEFLSSSKLAGEVGCDIDFQDGEPRDAIDTSVLGNSRYAGGHLHFDTDLDIPPDYCASVCDVMLAVTAIARGEKQGGRRGVYGLPGLYRPKPYGLEYRTMSNYWVTLVENDDPYFAHAVQRTADAFLTLKDDILMLPQRYGDYAKEIIATENQDEAINLMQIVQGVR